jgi:hypothetical protein
MIRHGVLDKPIRGSGKFCSAEGCNNLKTEGKQGNCSECKNKKAREWYANNLEKCLKSSKKWRENNKAQYLRNQGAYRLRVKGDPIFMEKKRAEGRVASEKLHDSYIKVVLGIKNPPQELIALKRVHLKIYRDLRAKNKELRKMVTTPAN